ncbi:MAG TPA: PAS domain-containing sensor histidine kinase [Longimicrobiales bacterium]|nr:PAS domain-containing sensor histidine kinase [Longimicrobiales bacterium]
MFPRPPSSEPPPPVPHAGNTAAVVFAAMALVALAVVPLILGQRAAQAQSDLAEILDPARLLGTRLSLVQARQMSHFQAFLFTRDPEARESYAAALREEEEIVGELQSLVGGMDLRIRERLAFLSSLSARWHVEHDGVFRSEVAREERLASFAQERERYEEMQRATLGLESAIQAEVDEGRVRGERFRTLQTRVSMGLLLLGLLATGAVALVGRRLRTLASEADARRRAEVRSRREMDALLEATADGVLGMDLRGRIVTLNRAGSELLGWSEGELRGRDVHEALHHTTRDGAPLPRAACGILGALSSRVMARSEGSDVLWRKDGSPLPVQWALRPLVDGLALRGGVLTFTDLTDILRKEEALQRAVRVREEVVSVVSHDLRNPLGVVAGAAELLLDLPLDEPERHRQADIIRRSAERMRRLIENLLDVARIEAGALVIRATAQSPDQVLSETKAFFHSQAEAKGVALELEMEPGVPRVLADPDRVQQALANLVTNALRFSPAGGAVTLGAHGLGGAEVALTVEDQGPGIPPADLPRLFDRFWQASRHDRTGSGLGLAIVRGIAEAHGGRVEVASGPGRGARFTLVLPGERSGGAREEP